MSNFFDLREQSAQKILNSTNLTVKQCMAYFKVPQWFVKAVRNRLIHKNLKPRIVERKEPKTTNYTQCFTTLPKTERIKLIQQQIELADKLADEQNRQKKVICVSPNTDVGITKVS